FRETSIAELEQQYLKDLILLTQGNVKKACQISGLSRSRLYALLKKCAISGFGSISSVIPPLMSCKTGQNPVLQK
ncbi:MAG: hypothetical protein E4G89_01655, partial [Methanothrix sp.]